MSNSLWLVTIINNPSLYSDFKEDLNKRINNLTQEGRRWVEEGNISKAQVAFGQVRAFESLLNFTNITIKEEAMKNEYIQKTAGSERTSSKRGTSKV